MLWVNPGKKSRDLRVEAFAEEANGLLDIATYQKERTSKLNSPVDCSPGRRAKTASPDWSTKAKGLSEREPLFTFGQSREKESGLAGGGVCRRGKRFKKVSTGIKTNGRYPNYFDFTWFLSDKIRL
ncbi:MAG: hypothetical protein IJY26_04270 [Clostridia bacterium]|nr:hypothetical protein [Clostridia bacterium]